MDNKNFGLSGKNENAMALIACIIDAATMNNLHGTNFINPKSKLQFIGIKNIAQIEE